MTARPGENTDPQGRFTLSGPYSALLDEFVVEGDTTSVSGLVLVHNTCASSLCDIEQDDSMAVLVTTVLAHECEDA